MIITPGTRDAGKPNGVPGSAKVPMQAWSREIPFKRWNARSSTMEMGQWMTMATSFYRFSTCQNKGVIEDRTEWFSWVFARNLRNFHGIHCSRSPSWFVWPSWHFANKHTPCAGRQNKLLKWRRNKKKLGFGYILLRRLLFAVRKHGGWTWSSHFLFEHASPTKL